MTYCLFSDLRHFDVKGNADHIGKLHDLYLDDQSWKIQWFVVETGGWFSSNKILLSPQNIVGITPASGTLHVALSQQDVENAPHAEEHPPVSDQRENELRYSAVNQHALLFPGYAGLMMPTTLIESAEPLSESEQALREAARNSSDRHLRSAGEIDGYGISASDGDLGSVSDLVINTDEWRTELLAVDTGKWLPGKQVVISPQGIDHISWTDREVAVTMDKNTIRESPDLNGLKSIERSYVARLNEYYRFPMVY